MILGVVASELSSISSEFASLLASSVECIALSSGWSYLALTPLSLLTIRFHSSRLETRTKESNMVAS